jgi:hypothetical protein
MEKKEMIVNQETLVIILCRQDRMIDQTIDIDIFYNYENKIILLNDFNKF